MDSKMNLLYITSDYPNVCGDTAFIDTEIKYVSQKFNHVVVMSHGNSKAACVSMPKNVSVLYFKKQTKNPLILNFFSCIPLLFHRELWREFFLIIKHKKEIRCFITALGFLNRAEKESKQIQKIAQEHDISLFYSFWYHHSVFACQLALKHMGLAGVKPMCTRTHRFDLYELRNSRHYQPYKIQMDENIDRVFFISRNGLEYYKRTFATRNDGTYTLSYLGTENDSPFTPHKYTDAIRLLSVSNVIPVKRVNLIIEALAACAQADIKIIWTHIGGGTEMETIRSLAQDKLDGYGCISYRFLGTKSNAEVHEYYRTNTVDLFVNMSESEGLPVSMMEAMSYGVPVAAPNVGGIGEIVDSSSGWLLSKDGCAAEFAAVVKQWLAMPEQDRHKRAVGAYNKWNALFNAEKNYTRFAEEMVRITINGSN